MPKIIEFDPTAQGPNAPDFSKNAEDIAYAEQFRSESAAKGFVVHVGYVEACDLYPYANAYAAIWHQTDYDKKLQELNDKYRSQWDVRYDGPYREVEIIPWEVMLYEPTFTEGSSRKDALQGALRKGYEQSQAQARLSAIRR